MSSLVLQLIAAMRKKNLRAPHRARVLFMLLVAIVVGACSTTFERQRLSAPADFTNVQSKTVEDVTVTVAILTNEQALKHFGTDLGERGVQAAWMSFRNGSPHRLWFIRNMLDPDFYSADEVAVLVRDSVPDDAFDQVRQDFRDESIRALTPAATINEGFVFLPKAEGGRYLDIRLLGDVFEEASLRIAAGEDPDATDGSSVRELHFGFALALPDGDFDYEQSDPSLNYAGQTLPDLDVDGLRTTLEQLPRCVTDKDGENNGDPLNIVLVGNGVDVLNALSRSGWSFTHRITPHTISREISAALGGKDYAVAPVSNLYLFGRSHDIAMQRARHSIAQRNHMRLWLAPFFLEGQQVWVGQVSRDIGIKLTTKSPTLTTHIIDPEVDTTREYLLHSLLAAGFVGRFGFVTGSAAASVTQPLYNLTDDPYFSDGMRLVIVLAPEPIPLSEVRSLLWEQSAAPDAEGQTEAAARNMRSTKLELPAGLQTYADGRMPIEELYRSYTSLLNRGWQLDIITQSQPVGTDYALPIIALRSPAPGQAVWIISGIHGEEPAGPNAIAASIDDLAALGEQRAVVLIPLSNPQGYARNWRYLNMPVYSAKVEGQSVGDSSYLLPDSEYPGPEHPNLARAAAASSPEAEAITRYVLSQSNSYPPAYSIDLHEDNLISEGYVYSQGVLGAGDPLAKTAVRVLQDNNIPLKTSGETRFGEPIENGIIGPVVDSSIDELMSAPQIVLDGQLQPGPAASTVLVFETPAKDTDLNTRIAAHAALLRELSRELSGSNGDQ